MKKQDVSYSDAIAEIEVILRKLDSAEADVDTIGEDVKRASELIKLCKTKLRKSEEEVEKALQ